MQTRANKRRIFNVEVAAKSNGANGSISNVEATGSNANRCEEMVWFSNVEALEKCKPAQEYGLISNEEAAAGSTGAKMGGNGLISNEAAAADSTGKHSEEIFNEEATAGSNGTAMSFCNVEAMGRNANPCENMV